MQSTRLHIPTVAILAFSGCTFLVALTDIASGAASSSVGSWPSGQALAGLVAKSKQSIENTYREEGFGVAISVVRSCYAHLQRLDWGPAQARCVSLDIAAYLYEFHLPPDFRSADISTDAYISPHEFNVRMNKYLPPPNGTLDEKKGYLTTIVHLVDAAPMSAANADSDGATAFVKRALARTADRRAFYEAELNRMMDAANSSGEEVIEVDPICQCQDDGGSYGIVSAEGGGDTYKVVVTDHSENWQLVLHRIGGAWKVFDVINKEGSVRALLKKALSKSTHG